MESKSDTETLIREGGYLNLTGKLLLTTLGAWMLDEVVNTKLRGSEQEVKAIVNVLVSSRRFQNELHSPGATIQSIVEKLNVKNIAAVEFERVLGIQWPL